MDRDRTPFVICIFYFTSVLVHFPLGTVPKFNKVKRGPLHHSLFYFPVLASIKPAGVFIGGI